MHEDLADLLTKLRDRIFGMKKKESVTDSNQRDEFDKLIKLAAEYEEAFAIARKLVSKEAGKRTLAEEETEDAIRKCGEVDIPKDAIYAEAEEKLDTIDTAVFNLARHTRGRLYAAMTHLVQSRANKARSELYASRKILDTTSELTSHSLSHGESRDESESVPRPRAR